MAKTTNKEETREQVMQRLTDERLDLQRQIADTEAEYKAELKSLNNRLASVENEFRSMFSARKS